MSLKIKLAYIGGGSKEWARVFMNDLALNKELYGEIALYDIDREAAERNMRIGERINANVNALSYWDYNVYNNLDDALNGADFVVISILPATFEEMRVDVHLPESFDVLQPVGDSVGPGGVIRAMRTVPTYFEFARKIEKNCPNAWVVNLTNPMSICVKALYDTFPKIKAFGCCHEVFHTLDMLCEMYEKYYGEQIKRSQLKTDICGVNHFVWLSKAQYRDFELTSLLPRFVDEYYETGFYAKGKDINSPFTAANRVKFDLYKKYGVLPTGGDRHIVEFLDNKLYCESRESIKNWKFALTTVDYRQARQIERIEESKELAGGLKAIVLKKSDEEVVDLIGALAGVGDRVSNVNIPNSNSCPQFKEGAIMEMNALFSHDKITPFVMSPLKDEVYPLVKKCSDNIETCYAGIKNKDLGLIFESFIAQPSLSHLSNSQCHELFGKMINGTKKYLSYYEK